MTTIDLPDLLTTHSTPLSLRTSQANSTEAELCLPAPEHPLLPGVHLEPFVAALRVPTAYRLPAESHRTEIEMREGLVQIHPALPAVPVWAYALPDEEVSAPGPLLEARAGHPATVRFANRLPMSTKPGAMAPDLPFRTNIAPDPANDTDPDPQNRLGAEGDIQQDLTRAPLGWTSVHLHGGHTQSDSDGWPDNMMSAGGAQLVRYDNTYDNLDLGLDKVGEFQWYHDHAMNGTRYHVYAGLAGGYLVRDDREAQWGLPTKADDGELVLVLQDRNLCVVDENLRFLHKTTPSTGEFFGPLTLVNGSVWPATTLRPEVYRLRLLNASNARTFRLHLVQLMPDGAGQVSQVSGQGHRVTILGTEGGLLWQAQPLGTDDALTLAPAERLDVLVDLTGLDTQSLHLVNSAPAPFGGQPAPSAGDLVTLLSDGDPGGKNPYPQVMRFDVAHDAVRRGKPHSLAATVGGDGHKPALNPAFRRLVHDQASAPTPDQPLPLPIEGHQHHVVLLAETDPPGHLYLQEIEKNPAGHIELQLPGASAAERYAVVGWAPDDPTPSSARMSFYDQMSILPSLGQWQVFVLVNVTGDTHPVHIHQSQFQPLGPTGSLLDFATGDTNRYDPLTRTTSAPITLLGDAGRAYEPAEQHGWKDVIRVDPGNVVKVAIRFDLPGRYVYHCHVLEHEDTDMMRPFVVTVGMPMPMPM